MIEFIAQFFTLAFLIVFITTMMLLGWPALFLMVALIIIFSTELITNIINTINNNT